MQLDVDLTIVTASQRTVQLSFFRKPSPLTMLFAGLGAVATMMIVAYFLVTNSYPPHEISTPVVEFAYPIRLSRLHRAPSPADKTLSGSNWIHEIKHDGYHNGSGVQQCDAQ